MHLKELCTKDSLIHSNYYSDTYRATVSVDGKGPKEWDIMHISLPFSPEKEAAFKAMFNLSDDCMTEYYQTMGKNIIHSCSVQDTLKKLPGSKGAAYCNLYEGRVTERKENTRGSDIFIFKSPAEPLVGSKLLSNEGVRLSNALIICAQLLQMSKALAADGVALGKYELDSMCITSDEKGVRIKNGSFLFSSVGDKSGFTLTPDAAKYVFGKSVADINEDNDVRAIIMLLWNMLSGKHFNEKCDLSVRPKYAPDKIVKMLEMGLECGADARNELITGLREAAQSVPDGYIRFATPSYSTQVEDATARYKAEQKRLEEQEEARIRAQEDAEEKEKNKSASEKILKILKDGILGTGKDEDNEEEQDENDEERRPRREKRPPVFERMTGKQIAGLVITSIVLASLTVAGSFFVGKYKGELPFQTVHEQVIGEDNETYTEAIEERGEETTPEATPSPRPITDGERITVVLDDNYDWYRSDYPADEICAIIFQISYEPEYPALEHWNFNLNSDNTQCYIYERPAASNLKCGPSGDKVLVIAGNGTGKLNIKRTQEELLDYFAYKFTYAQLNNLNDLCSIGSTPVYIPVITPEPEPSYPPDDDAPEPEYNGYYSQQDNYYSGNNGYNGGYAQNEGYNGTNPGGYSTITEYQTEVTNTVNLNETWGDEVETRSFSITTSNDSVHVGGSITLKLTGAWTGAVNVWSSDPGVATVSTTPDANGYYIISGVRPGTVTIFATALNEIDVEPGVTIMVN